DVERTPRQLKEPPEKLNHLYGTLVVTSDRAPAGDVVTEAFGEVLVPQRVQVASSERCKPLPYQVLVWMCHQDRCACAITHRQRAVGRRHSRLARGAGQSLWPPQAVNLPS